jgi:hypothetical protein
MKKIFPFALVLVLLLSCKNDGKLILKNSMGKINSLVIVIDNKEWMGKPGDALRNIIGAPVLGLPQEETQFSVTQAPIKAFKTIFKTSRNLLLIGFDEKESYTVKKELYASPQVIMTILGKDEVSLLALIEKHKKEIISVFKDADLKVYQKKLAKNSLVNDSLKTLKKLNVAISIPTDYRLVDDTGDFLWFRKHIDKGDLNLIAYELPLKENEDIVNSITASRDTIGKKYIPGSKEGMYMITEAAYSPHIISTKLNNLSAYETRGKWEVKNDFMAGPFINYTIVDKANNRLLVFEGFTYAPNAKKRDYMFELEAIIKTLKI